VRTLAFNDAGLKRSFHDKNPDCKRLNNRDEQTGNDMFWSHALSITIFVSKSLAPVDNSGKAI
jgi:hypothetical protein